MYRNAHIFMYVYRNFLHILHAELLEKLVLVYLSVCLILTIVSVLLRLYCCVMAYSIWNDGTLTMYRCCK